MFNNNFNRQLTHIYFIRNVQFGAADQNFVRPQPLGVTAQRYSSNIDNKFGCNKICLLNKLEDIDLFQKMPKTFIITTNTGSCNFNIEMISITSSVICDFLKDNPHHFQYHIDIDDKDNILSKIKQMYEGKTAVFDEDQLPITHKITKILNLTCFPNFLKPESLKGNESAPYGRVPSPILAAELQKSEFPFYLKSVAPCSFTIATKKREYKVKIFGILSSAVLSDIVTKDPTATAYSYDFEDKFDEFNDVCDFFNFQTITITANNMDSIKEIAEDLQITCLLNDVEKYINNRENVSKTIDEQQAIIDTVDELFDLLYNIKEITVPTVSKKIINSKWSQTEDKVHELAAFIIQVIKTDILLHKYILDLLCLIDKDSNESSKLKILLPFVISILTFSAFGFINEKQGNHNQYPCVMKNNFIGSSSRMVSSNKIGKNQNMAICAFIYNLHKNGLISKEDINDYLANYSLNVFEINLWFLPELIEIYTIEKVLNSNRYDNKTKRFIDLYLPDNIDRYIEMRNKGEPMDALTKALRDDDVDTLQSIVSKSQIYFKKTFVPFNIFENFIDNGNTRYINYAAAYGSLKCFKFLLLNHDSIDNYSFPYAVFGGNTEIIKIIYQNNKDEDDFPVFNNPNQFNQFDCNKSSYDKLIPSIIKHRNDLFDWIFEQIVLNNKKENNSTFLSYLKCSAENGNAHSLIEIIEKLNFGNDQIILIEILACAAENGFYMVTQLLSKFITNKSNYVNNTNINLTQTLNYDNLSIFKLFMTKMNQQQLINSLIFAVKRNYMSIVNYFFNEIINNIDFDISISTYLSFDLLIESITNKTNKMFNYLLNKIKELDPSFFNDVRRLDQLLNQVCTSTKNAEIAKILTELIIKMNSNWYFTSHFKNAAANGSTEICKYFIDKKVFVEYEKLSSYIKEISAINEELFIIIVKNVSPEIKELFFGCLDQAIQNKNKKLVDYLLKEGTFSDSALKLAVMTNDLELVDIVLKYNSEPSFINKQFIDGTALTIAVANNNLSIFKRLLSLPGIDPNLFGSNNKNALIESVRKRNLEIFDTILDFYGENIHQHRWMINKIIQMFVDKQEPTNNNIKLNDGIPKYTRPGSINKQNNQNDGIEVISPEKEKLATNHILSSLLNLKCVDINYHYNVHTLLTYACSTNNFILVGSILECEKVDVNMPESQNGDTPLIICTKENNFEIAKLLVGHPQIDVNAQNFYQQTALTIASSSNLNNFIDLITNNKKFDPKKSRLNYAFFISKGETAKNLFAINSLDVNYIDYATFRTSLTNAVLSNEIEMALLIISHPSFDKNKSQLGTAIKESISNDEIDIFIKLVKGLGDKINSFKVDDRNILDFAAINSSQGIINEVLKNPDFDSKKSDILKAFVDSYTVRINQNNMMMNNQNNMMMNNQNNMMMNNQNNMMMNYQNNMMMNNQNNMMMNNQNNMMMNNQNNMMMNNRNNMMMNNRNNMMMNANNNMASNQNKSPVNVMKQLYEYDEKHDHLIDFNNLLPNGKSFYTSITSSSEFNEDVTQFLLDHGADPNKPDSNGIFPLESAINLDLIDIVLELINSDAIDFKQKIKIINTEESDQSNPKYTTYLHLAAQLSNSEILEEILNKNEIDINATNDLGDTPLIEACRKKNKKNVMILFESDFCGNSQIDFLHKNNNGEDAMHAANPNANSESITDKDEYLETLLSYLNNNGDDVTSDYEENF